MKFFKTLLLSFVFVNAIVAQSDTLHLNFAPTQTVPNDTIEARIVKWGKSLKGQHVDIDVVAYYHKSDFKKLADTRVDEMYLSLNRKVRDLITIKSQGSKKGKDSQRTRVDIIYWPSGTDGKAAVADKKKDDKTDDKKGDKKEDKKDKKEDSKVSSNSNSNQKSDNKSTSSNNQSNQTNGNRNKGGDMDSKGNIIINSTPTGKTYNDTKAEVDTVYVNGVPKLVKKKKK